MSISPAQHTHGGLINLPRVGLALSVINLGPKYLSGMFDFGGAKVYVC